MRRTLVLPAPDGPMMDTISLASTSRSRASSTVRDPYRLVTLLKRTMGPSDPRLVG